MVYGNYCPDMRLYFEYDPFYCTVSTSHYILFGKYMFENERYKSFRKIEQTHNVGEAGILPLLLLRILCYIFILYKFWTRIDNDKTLIV